MLGIGLAHPFMALGMLSLSLVGTFQVLGLRECLPTVVLVDAWNGMPPPIWSPSGRLVFGNG